MICPGRVKDAPLTFAQVLEKAQKFHQQKMYVAAIPYYSAMLELTERPLGIFHFQCGNILEALSLCYEQSGHLDKAVLVLQRAILIKESVSDGSIEKTKEVFFSMGRLAEMYMVMGNLPIAKGILQKMDETAAETFGKDSFERGRALCSLAGCLERSEEVEEAEKKLTECIQLEEYINPSDKQKLASSSIAFYNLGMICLNLKRQEEARTHFERALKMKRDAGLASDHPDVVEYSKALEGAKVQ